MRSESEAVLPFIDTDRTLCLAPSVEVRRAFDALRARGFFVGPLVHYRGATL